MNRDDGIRIVARLMGAWPAQDWPDATVEMWLEDLEAWTVEEAHAAVQACRRAYDWSPSWHQFYEALRDAKRLQNRTIYRRELTPGVMTKEAQVQAVQMVRDWYRDARRKRVEHDHRGPEPCPVCGGVRPKKASDVGA